MASLGIVITADNKALLKALKEGEKEAEKFASEMEDAGKAIDKTFETTPSKVEEVTEQLHVQKKVVKELEAELEKAKVAFDEVNVSGYGDPMSDQREKAKKHYTEVRAELNAEKTSLVELEKEASKYVSVIDTVGKSIDKSFGTAPAKINEVTDQIRIQKKVIEELERQYDKAKAEFDEVNVSGYGEQITQQREKAKKLFTEVRAELNAEKKGLDELEKEFVKLGQAQDKAGKSQNGYLTQMRKIQDEMAGLVSEGKKETDRYRELQKELEKLGTAYNVVQKEKKQLTTGGSDLGGLLSGLSAASGAFSAVQGVMSYFVKDNDRLVAIQTKLQAAMAITVGLQQISNTLHQTSLFRIKTVTTVTNIWTAAQNRLSVALGISTVAAQVLMGALTLGLSVAIGAAIGWLNKYIDKQKKAAEDQKAFTEAVVSNSTESIATFEKLRKSYDKLGNSIDGKTKFIMENQEEFNKLGVAIMNVNDADNAFINNAEAFKQSIMLRAKAAAAMELAAEKYKESLQKMAEADSREKTPTMWDNATGFKYTNKDGVRENTATVKAVEKLRKEGGKSAEEAQAFINQSLIFSEEERERLKDADIKLLNSLAKDTKAWWEQYKKVQEDALDRFTNDQKGSAEWEKIATERDKAAKILEAWDKGKSTKELNREEKGRLDAERKLNEMIRVLGNERLANQLESQQKSIDLMDDGFGKRYAQIELDYEKELQAIKEYEAKKRKEQEDAAKDIFTSKNGPDAVFDFAKFDLSSLPEGLRPEDVKARMEQMFSEAVAAWMKARLQIVKDEVEFNDDIYSYFEDSLQKQEKEINRYWDDQRVKAKGNADTLAKIEGNRQTELTKLHVNANLDRIAFDEEMNQRAVAISRKFYLFESDRLKELAILRKKYQEQRLKELEKVPVDTRTAEEADEIERLKKSIKGTGEELEDLDSSKMREIADFAARIANSLSELDGEAGEFFSGLGSQISNINDALDETAKTPEKVSTAISGLVSVISMIASASSHRKEAEREFYQNSIALAHEYALALNEQLRLQNELSGSGFVNDYAGRLNSGFDALVDATGKYNEALSKLSTGKAKIDLRNAIDWGSVGKGAAGGAAMGAAIGSLIVPVIGTAIGAVVGGVAGFFTGLFGGKKKKAEYAGLLSVFPELVDGAGNLNKELARTIIDTNQVDDNTKQLLQNTLDWADAVKAANEQIKAITVELAGDLGNNLKNAMVEAWKAGEDASARMFDAASDSLEGFIENLLYSLVFSDVFDEFGNRLANSLDPDKGDGDILDDFDWLMKQMGERDEAYLSMLDAYKKRAKETGFDLWTSDKEDEENNRTSTAKGITSMTQDSANELNGNFYALRLTVNDILNILKATLPVIANGGPDYAVHGKAMTQMLQQQLQVQIQIERNTLRTSNGIYEIINQGVKIKE